jgi:hypothetical protein
MAWWAHLFLLIFVFANPAHALRCEAVFISSPFQILPDDLQNHYRNEIKNLRGREIEQLNAKTLDTLQNYVPPFYGDRARSVSLDQLYKVLKITDASSVVGWEARAKYNREDVEIGYCFGRAAYIHLLLLKMGLQKESIKKIWLVGPTQTNDKDVIWQYHVATMAYTTELGWVTIDTGQIKPQPVRHWMDYYMSRSIDGRSRFYVTEPDKFGFQLGTYDRTQMGLNSTSEEDWFRGYFPDMLREIRITSLESLGLTKSPKFPVSEQVNLPRNPVPPKSKSILQSLKDSIWP